jgi:hypothetical protein
LGTAPASVLLQISVLDDRTDARAIPNAGYTFGDSLKCILRYSGGLSDLFEDFRGVPVQNREFIYNADIFDKTEAGAVPNADYNAGAGYNVYWEVLVIYLKISEGGTSSKHKFNTSGIP